MNVALASHDQLINYSCLIRFAAWRYPDGYLWSQSGLMQLLGH